jgi:ATP-dependent Clp protease ATP-binding subunit ClpC
LTKKIVVFDEIEKAGAGICDLFLSMMGEGRVTEQGSGKVADFTQALIVLTSNAELDAIMPLVDQFDDPFQLGQAVRAVLRNSQQFRPEIVSRFDQIYVFKYLEGRVSAEITALKIAKAAEEYGVHIEHIHHELVHRIMEQADVARDTRELVRIVDTTLGELLLQARAAGARQVRIDLGPEGEPVLEELE